MTIAEFIKLYPEHEEEITERAAIIEFDGNVKKSVAELEAVRIIKWKYGIIYKG